VPAKTLREQLGGVWTERIGAYRRRPS